MKKVQAAFECRFGGAGQAACTLNGARQWEALFRFARQYRAFAGMVGGGHHAFGFELVNQRGGFVVADAQMALQRRYGGLFGA